MAAAEAIRVRWVPLERLCTGNSSHRCSKPSIRRRRRQVALLLLLSKCPGGRYGIRTFALDTPWHIRLFQSQDTASPCMLGDTRWRLPKHDPHSLSSVGRRRRDIGPCKRSEYRCSLDTGHHTCPKGVAVRPSMLCSACALLPLPRVQGS